MNVPGASSPRNHHFSREEEEELHKDPSTSAILNKVRSDANIGGPGIEVRGDDKTWRATKQEQQSHVGVAGGLSIAHAAAEAVHLAELHTVEAATLGGLSVAGGLVIAGTLGGAALGVSEWLEAHHKGKEQAAALTKDEMHVAMLTQLDLPNGYKAGQIAQRSQAGSSAQSVAMKMATPFSTIDKPLLATMQLHADRGMRSGLDFLESGMPKDRFLAANPKIAEAYAKDPAFHDGFDSMEWAKKQGPGEYEATKAKLNERDGWYQQSNVTYRL